MRQFIQKKISLLRFKFIIMFLVSFIIQAAGSPISPRKLQFQATCSGINECTMNSDSVVYNSCFGQCNSGSIGDSCQTGLCCEFPKSQHAGTQTNQIHLKTLTSADYQVNQPLLDTTDFFKLPPLQDISSVLSLDMFYQYQQSDCLSQCDDLTLYSWQLVDPFADFPLTGSFSGLDGSPYDFDSLLLLSSGASPNCFPVFKAEVDPFKGPYSIDFRIKFECSSCDSSWNLQITDTISFSTTGTCGSQPVPNSPINLISDPIISSSIGNPQNTQIGTDYIFNSFGSSNNGCPLLYSVTQVTPLNTVPISSQNSPGLSGANSFTFPNYRVQNLFKIQATDPVGNVFITSWQSSLTTPPRISSCTGINECTETAGSVIYNKCYGQCLSGADPLESCMIETCCEFPKTEHVGTSINIVQTKPGLTLSDFVLSIYLANVDNYRADMYITDNISEFFNKYFQTQNEECFTQCVDDSLYNWSLIDQSNDVPLTGTITGQDGISYDYSSLIKIQQNCDHNLNADIDPFKGPYSINFKLKFECQTCDSSWNSQISDVITFSTTGSCVGLSSINTISDPTISTQIGNPSNAQVGSQYLFNSFYSSQPACPLKYTLQNVSPVILAPINLPSFSQLSQGITQSNVFNFYTSGIDFTFSIQAQDPLGNVYTTYQQSSLSTTPHIAQCSGVNQCTKTSNGEIYDKCFGQCLSGSNSAEICSIETCCDFPKVQEHGSNFYAVSLKTTLTITDYYFSEDLFDSTNYLLQANTQVSPGFIDRYFQVVNNECFIQCFDSSLYSWTLIDHTNDVPLTGSFTGLDGSTQDIGDLIILETQLGPNCLPVFRVEKDPFIGPYTIQYRLKFECPTCDSSWNNQISDVITYSATSSCTGPASSNSISDPTISLFVGSPINEQTNSSTYAFNSFHSSNTACPLKYDISIINPASSINVNHFTGISAYNSLTFIGLGVTYLFNIRASDPLGNTFTTTQQSSLTTPAQLGTCHGDSSINFNQCVSPAPYKIVYLYCYYQCPKKNYKVGDPCIPSDCCDFPKGSQENNPLFQSQVTAVKNPDPLRMTIKLSDNTMFRNWISMEAQIPNIVERVQTQQLFTYNSQICAKQISIYSYEIFDEILDSPLTGSVSALQSLPGLPGRKHNQDFVQLIYSQSTGDILLQSYAYPWYGDYSIRFRVKWICLATYCGTQKTQFSDIIEATGTSTCVDPQLVSNSISAPSQISAYLNNDLTLELNLFINLRTYTFNSFTSSNSNCALYYALKEPLASIFHPSNQLDQVIQYNNAINNNFNFVSIWRNFQDLGQFSFEIMAYDMLGNSLQASQQSYVTLSCPINEQNPRPRWLGQYPLVERVPLRLTGGVNQVLTYQFDRIVGSITQCPQDSIAVTCKICQSSTCGSCSSTVRFSTSLYNSILNKNTFDIFYDNTKKGIYFIDFDVTMKAGSPPDFSSSPVTSHPNPLPRFVVECDKDSVTVNLDESSYTQDQIIQKVQVQGPYENRKIGFTFPGFQTSSTECTVTNQAIYSHTKLDSRQYSDLHSSFQVRNTCGQIPSNALNCQTQCDNRLGLCSVEHPTGKTHFCGEGNSCCKDASDIDDLGCSQNFVADGTEICSYSQDCQNNQVEKTVDDQYFFELVQQQLISNYTFSLGGFVQTHNGIISYLSSTQFHLQIYCGVGSTIISYSSNFIENQVRSALPLDSQDKVYFEFGDFINYNRGCPIIQRKQQLLEYSNQPSEYINEDAVYNLQTGKYQFNLKNISAAGTYSFYLYFQADGGTEFLYPNKVSLFVNCTLSSLKISPPSKPQVDHQVYYVQNVDSREDINFYFDDVLTNNPFCHTNTKNQSQSNNRVDASPFLSHLAVFETKNQKFNFKVLDPTAQLNIKFYILYQTIQAHNQWYSPKKQIELICGNDSTAFIQPQIKTNNDGYFYQLDAPNNIYMLDTLRLSNPACTFTNITLINLKISNQTDFANDIKNQTGDVVVTLFNEKPKVTLPSMGSLIFQYYSFNIRYQAEGGHTSESPKIQIKHIDCSNYQPMQHLEVQTLKVEFIQDEITFWDAKNISDQFMSLDDCPFLQYRITKIINTSDNSTVWDYEKYAKVNNEGMFEIKYFTSVTQFFKIYVDVTASQSLNNETLWSNSILPATTLKINHRVNPNIRPSFKEKLIDKVYVINKTNEQISYQFPDIYDPEGDEVVLQITKGFNNDTMIYYSNARKVVIIPIEPETIELMINIFDSNGNFINYKVKIIIEFQISVNENTQNGAVKIGAQNQTCETNKICSNEKEEHRLEPDEIVDKNGIVKQIVPLKYKSFIKNFVEDIQIDQNAKKEEYKESQLTFQMSVEKIESDGELVLSFSHEIFSIEELKQNGMNMTLLNKLRFGVMNIKYSKAQQNEDLINDQSLNRRRLQQQDPLKQSQLKNWVFKNITNDIVVVKLLFENPLYVSSSQAKDKISLKILMPELFRSKESNEIIQQQSIEDVTLPQMMASQEQFKIMKQATKVFGDSVTLTLIIPLWFQVLGNISMNNVWQLYLMLQIVSHILKYESLVTPAPALNTVVVLYNISYFKLFQEKNVQRYMRKNIFGSFQNLQSFLFGNGNLIMVSIVIALGLIAILLFKIIKFKKNFVLRMKDKIMWNPVFRSMIQFYLPTCLMSLTEFRDTKNYKLKELVIGIYQLISVIALPFISFFILKRNKKNLENPQFMQKYGNLYTNLYPLRNSVFYYISIFCCRRLILAVFTVWLNDQIMLNASVYIYSSIFYFAWLVNNSPMMNKSQNWMDNLNEINVYNTAFYILIYSEWTDVETRYYAGFIFQFNQIFFVCLNIMVIVRVSLTGFRRIYLKRKWLQAISKNIMEKQSLVKQILELFDIRGKYQNRILKLQYEKTSIEALKIILKKKQADKNKFLIVGVYSTSQVRQAKPQKQVRDAEPIKLIQKQKIVEIQKEQDIELAQKTINIETHQPEETDRSAYQVLNLIQEQNLKIQKKSLKKLEKQKMELSQFQDQIYIQVNDSNERDPKLMNKYKKLVDQHLEQVKHQEKLEIMNLPQDLPIEKIIEMQDQIVNNYRSYRNQLQDIVQHDLQTNQVKSPEVKIGQASSKTFLNLGSSKKLIKSQLSPRILFNIKSRTPEVSTIVGIMRKHDSSDFDGNEIQFSDGGGSSFEMSREMEVLKETS